MGYITKFGGFWGMLPQTAGRIFWVAPSASYTVEGRSYTASDGNDGLSPERALLTVDYAVGLTTANVGDVIVLLPGAHSTAATIAVDVAGITITGLPGSGSVPSTRTNRGPRTNLASVTNTAAGGIVFTVSANDVEIAWVHLLPVTVGRGIHIAASTSRTYIHDVTCDFTGVVSVTTYGITLNTLATGTTVDTVIRNCYFINGTGSGANGAAVAIIGTAYGTSIENCTFDHRGTGAWARAIGLESLVNGSSSIMIRDCDFINSSSATSVITTAVFATGTQIDGALKMYRCYVDAGTDVATATASADIVLAETYLASNAGGALGANS